jgi:energy-coupling factor transport system ATP-binding protein
VPEPFLEVEDLTYVYHPNTPQAVVAIDGLSLLVGRGEYLGIAGGNGSGKSTLAKHFNALLLPTSGHVRVAGIDTQERDRVWDIRSRVGMVFQNPDNQLISTVVEEDVAFGPENLGLAPEVIRERVDRALDAVGMGAYRRHEPHRLSGGQKQRVAIAGVLAMQPDCIVLDEPTTMLDPEGRTEVLATVRALHRDRGITVVLISHSLDDLVDAGRIVIMDGGHIALDGPVAQVFDRLATSSIGRIEPPPVVRLAQWLRDDGLAIPSGVYTIDALADAIVTAARGKGRRA